MMESRAVQPALEIAVRCLPLLHLLIAVVIALDDKKVLTNTSLASISLRHTQDEREALARLNGPAAKSAGRTNTELSLERLTKRPLEQMKFVASIGKRLRPSRFFHTFQVESMQCCVQIRFVLYKMNSNDLMSTASVHGGVVSVATCQVGCYTSTLWRKPRNFIQQLRG